MIITCMIVLVFVPGSIAAIELLLRRTLQRFNQY